jgi:septum formation protein
MKVILASKSPRRKELLGEIYGSFEIITEETDESLPSEIHPREGVAILAQRKGEAVFNAQKDLRDDIDECLIISSDTLVEKDGEALGKPVSREDAHRMLRSLSGCTHNVHTGVAVRYHGKTVARTASTEVSFYELSDEEIEAYIDSGEPMDKAGAYGIQGLAGKFVSGISGDFDTVVGLSLTLLRALILEVGGEI